MSVKVAKFEIKGQFFRVFQFFYYIKQIDSMLPCICSVIDHRGRQNVVRTSVTHSAAPRVPLFCPCHILTSSVIYYCTDARQHGIYLLIVEQHNDQLPVGLIAQLAEHCTSFAEVRVLDPFRPEFFRLFSRLL